MKEIAWVFKLLSFGPLDPELDRLFEKDVLEVMALERRLKIKPMMLGGGEELLW